MTSPGLTGENHLREGDGVRRGQERRKEKTHGESDKMVCWPTTTIAKNCTVPKKQIVQQTDGPHPNREGEKKNQQGRSNGQGNIRDAATDGAKFVCWVTQKHPRIV